MDHEAYMRRALELAAQAAEQGDVPVGCVIVRDGEIVGVLYRTLVVESMTCAIAISNLKPMLEVLYNGKSVPYLGINGMTVPDEVTEQTGMPSGVYVTEVIQDLSLIHI